MKSPYTSVPCGSRKRSSYLEEWNLLSVLLDSQVLPLYGDTYASAQNIHGSPFAVVKTSLEEAVGNLLRFVLVLKGYEGTEMFVFLPTMVASFQCRQGLERLGGRGGLGTINQPYYHTR